MQISAIGPALSGIQRGFNTARSQAAAIASADALSHPPARDVTEPLIYMMAAKTQVEASVKVLRTADTMMGSLLDALA